MSNSDKGFGSMDKDKVKEIAKKGGKTIHKGENHSDEEKDDHEDTEDSSEDTNSSDNK